MDFCFVLARSDTFWCLVESEDDVCVWISFFVYGREAGLGTSDASGLQCATVVSASLEREFYGKPLI